MRVRWLSLITSGAVAIATVAALSTAASASASAPRVLHHGMASGHVNVPALSILYNQNNNDSGVGLVSDNFDAAFDIYDDQAADDFVVPSGTKWLVQGVAVTGVYFNGPGPADSENVFIYKDAAGLPGATVGSRLAVVGADTAGSFKIKVNPGIGLATSGTYWVSVQSNQNFSGGFGEWGWEARSVQSGNLAAWQNPSNGFGTGCTTWAPMQTCLGFGPDLMFIIAGKHQP